MVKKILITGGCGFIGHHFAEHVHIVTDWDIIIIDMLTYASKGLQRLKSSGLLHSPRVKLLTYNLCTPLSVGIIQELGQVDIIVHMAAETHVDNSIRDPVYVVTNNVQSTLNILEYARTLKNLQCFFYFSTDEVFGPALGDKLYQEDDRHRPANPYAASKSAAEMICLSYENTYKLPLIIVNVMNAFGERQHVEKFIPLCIKKILNDEKVYIHAYPDCITSGSRFYIHARNIASAVLFLLQKGAIGEKYNISGEKEMTNLELAQFIATQLGKELKYELVDFHSDRPGHDLRYGLDGTKLMQLGWAPPKNFEESLAKTIRWTLDHPEWLEE